MLLTKIRDDLKTAIKNKDENTKNALRLVIGEIPRLNKKAKELVTDEEVQKIITQLLKSEALTMEYSGQDTFPLRDVLDQYLPSMMTPAEIQSWITMNINLYKYNPTIKAMGDIMKRLKGKADGKVVKDILLEKNLITTKL